MGVGMIATCPNCATQYQVGETSFTTVGRTVKCAKCRYTWHQRGPEPSGPPDELAAPTKTIPVTPGLSPGKLIAVEAHAATELHQDLSVAQAAIEASSILFRALFRAFFAAVTLRRPGSFRLLAFAVALASIALVCSAAVRYRQNIVNEWPASAIAYSVLGLKVEPLGIGLRDISYHRVLEYDFSTALIINGTIENSADRELPVPKSIIVDLTDSRNHNLYHTSIMPSVAKLPAGQSVSFVTQINNAPAGAEHLEMRFDDH
jgi:predicted Zn finger-like uncharacterized protein